jgi:PqqD family protein of HPr-rel-A system
MRYRAAAPDTLRIEPLGELTAIYHRASGITHLLAEPAPELLSLLAEEPLDERELLARLAERFDVGDGDSDTLSARLAELMQAGLVEAVPRER